MQRLRYSRYMKFIVVTLDLLVLAGIFVYFFFSNNLGLLYDKQVWYNQAFALSLLILFWLLLSGRTKIYNISRNLTITLFLERVLVHITLFSLGVFLIGKVSTNLFFSNNFYWLIFSLFFCVLLVKSFVFLAIKYFRSIGVNYRNAMFLGENSSTEVLKGVLIKRKDYGYKIFEYQDKDENLDTLVGFWRENGIHTLFMPVENSFTDAVEDEIIRYAEANKVNISFVPNITKNDFFLYNLGYINTQPILHQAKYPLEYYSNYLLKRTFDIVFSTIILVGICSWLFPIIAIIIKLNSKGPVFFLQKRYGFHEDVFNCIKFRTMIVNENSSTSTTKDNDERITSIGKFLRKTSLDEMPQFFNVLKGEMSVVGPRPHMLIVDDYYKEKIRRYSLRSHVNPGITGLAQVSGLRGDFGDVEIEMNKRVLADAFYVRNWSFVLDLIIIFKTILLMLTGDKNAK